MSSQLLRSNFSRIYAVCSLECRLLAKSVTNWAIVTGVFVLFAVPALLTPEGGTGTPEESPLVVLEETHSISAYYWFQGIDIFIIFLPLLALLFGYGTFSADRETGSLTVLGSLPITRVDIYLGKAFARIGVFSVVVLVGVLIGWVCVSVLDSTSTVASVTHLVAGLPTVVFAVGLVSIAVAISGLLDTRLQTLTGAIVGYFALIFGAVSIFDAVPVAIVGHPFHGYSVLVAFLFDSMYPPLRLFLSSRNGSLLELLVTEPVALVVLLVWVCCPLAIGYLGFRREVFTP